MEAGKKPVHPPAWSRYFRRLIRPFLTREEKDRIAAAIRDAERRTTGEIHVHVVERSKGDILDLARRKFAELGLDKTEGRNGVLILVAHLDHRFAIWGDSAVHAKAGDELWSRARGALLERFAARRYAEGLAACVEEVGRALALHFPKDEGPGKDQLTNEVTEG